MPSHSERRCDWCKTVIEDDGVRVVDAVGDELDPPSTELYCSVGCAATADYNAVLDGDRTGPRYRALSGRDRDEAIRESNQRAGGDPYGG